MARLLIDRRDFVRGAGLAFLAGLAPRPLQAATEADAVYAAAFQKRSGEYGLAVLSEAGELIHSVVLPDRGHDACFDPVTNRTVVFARQPGTFAMVLDHGNRLPPTIISSVPGRHFYGHGIFSRDGALLYATENDYDNAAGMIGIYDARDGFTRIGEFPTHGIGPHEMLLLRDGETFAVANGGIETHPDFGRAKLNLSAMRPSLAFIDRASGRLLGKFETAPDLHQLSIRHMDEDMSGQIWFGCQYEGPATDRPPLIGMATPETGIGFASLPADILGGFRNYIGSVAANRDAGTIAFTSPQGNSLAVLDCASGAVLASRAMVEVCGIAPEADGFIATAGTGQIEPATGPAARHADIVFDNHVLKIG